MHHSINGYLITRLSLVQRIVIYGINRERAHITQDVDTREHDINKLVG